MDGLYGNHKVGEQISNKELLSYQGRNKHRHHLWTWKCLSCESEGGPSTIAHLSRSDRCGKKCMSGEGNPRWKGYKELTGRKLYEIEYGAKKRGYEFNVTPEYLWRVWELQEGRCHFTGRKLAHGVDASLDRIINSEGYIVGNVAWVHKDVNRVKSNVGLIEFAKICHEVSGWLSGRDKPILELSEEEFEDYLQNKISVILDLDSEV